MKGSWLLLTFGITIDGAIAKSTGFVAASPYESNRANGFTPYFFAPSTVVITTAAAPSFSVEALPAVMVPSEYRNLHKISIIN